MVLMRRKDKRKGNSESELAVASDASIVANKGVRSLGGARTGRFAADMRVQVGGYGRPDKTWGVDHPWHLTRDDLLNQMSSRDKMEEGFLVKEEEKKEGQGLSRAALKKKKKKAKLGGAGMGASEDGDASSRMSTHSVDAAQGHESKQESGGKEKKQDQTNTTSTNADKDGEHLAATADAAAGASKKRKRIKRNKKKLERQRQMESGDISDELGDSDDDEDEPKQSIINTNKKQKTTTATKADAPESAESAKKAKEADAKARDALAKQYELALGQEFKTASGLTIRDVRIGKGRVPAAGEMLTARYRGRIGDHSGFVFGKGMLTTNFGTGSVIAGWEEGMGTMRAGGIRYLTVPPELGYGEVAKGNGKIPPNSTLFFEVELVRIGKRKRDAVGKDEIPLPSSFQRKRIPAAKNNATNAGDKKKGKSKRSRRKHSI